MDMTLIFKQADTQQADRLYEILRACGQDMKTRFELTHWDPLYPLEFFEKDVLAGKVYAVSENGELIATFTMSVEPLVYYFSQLWSDPSIVAMYVNHMAVLPEYQGKGVGRKCMERIEQDSLELGCGAVRLDAYEKNEHAVKFYDQLGYERREIIMYRGLPLLCFDNLLKND